MLRSDSHRLLLRSIAMFKFIKATLLVAAGIGALRLQNKDIFAYAAELVGKYHLNPGNHVVMQILARTTHITPRRLHELGIGAFVYAALFLAEGLGLWTLQRWGEWITVLITGSLLPLEIYELYDRLTLPRGAVLVLNAVIVWYLVVRLHGETRDRSVGVVDDERNYGSV
ncbi:MAG TPA: DUF2127 domain-containing protein [Terriglobales bacterium]|nr:DUF2127 domain-containing protein [Terriglobales bacterium]